MIPMYSLQVTLVQPSILFIDHAPIRISHFPLNSNYLLASFPQNMEGNDK